MVFLFAATLFVSAALLFLVQPMVGRMILPTLGGTPAVWNTCMVFFQAVLLAGYAYSHASVKILGVRRQAILHLIVLLIPLSVLPISIAQGVRPPTNDNPGPWLLWQLFLYVGAPFFIVSTSGPLLQHWFAQTGHADAKDPYYLYAVSNFGSLLALLGYPLLVEPSFALHDQSRMWAIGYIVLICLIAVCGLTVLRRSLRAIPETLIDHTAAFDVPVSTNEPAWPSTELAVPDFKLRVWWVLLSCVPSSLMLGVTSYITTDLAALPLFWVLPLALYLLTIVFAFARKPPFSLRTLSLLLPAILPLWLITLVPLPIWMMILCHLLIFFLLAMMCHARLAAGRPAAKHLTEFYFWMSLGGLLGGFFNALLAPLVFNRVIEYHVMIALACMLKPIVEKSQKIEKSKSPNEEEFADILMESRDRGLESRVDFLAPAILFVFAFAIISALRKLELQSDMPGRIVAYIVLPFACFCFRGRPIRFGLSVAAMLAIGVFFSEQGRGAGLHRERNFYGAKQIRLNPLGTFRELVHGGITHGVQSTDPGLAREPFAYYHRSGPIGDIFAECGRRAEGRRVAVIGLGTGAMAAYAEPEDAFTFYEIDPAVARLAENTEYFSYLSGCAGKYSIRLGDGRLTLSRAEPGEYDLIIIDAFSSDSIPVHLIGREAIKLYVSKLAEGGVLVFHLSNLYLNIEPVVGNLAKDSRLVGKARYHRLPDENVKLGIFPSCYAALARRSEDLSTLNASSWHQIKTDPHKAVWTDQYCNVLGIVRWR